MIIPADRCREILDGIKGKKVAVLGDLMLDEYLIGHVNRISPEAPVPVVEIKDATLRLGGAANVCLNLSSLGSSVLPFGVAGFDREADELFSLLKEFRIEETGLLRSKERKTTKKTRIIGEGQQVCRVDREDSFDLSGSEEKQLIDLFKDHISEIDAVIFEDYNKGVITKKVIHSVIELCKSKNIPTFVDPKFTNFFEYSGVTLFKPNLREISTALSLKLENTEEYKNAARILKDKLSAENILITLGAEGMMVLDRKGEFYHEATKALEVADVSGAGDTVISTLCATYIAGASLKEAVTLANEAAGIVVSELGIVPIEPGQLLEKHR